LGRLLADAAQRAPALFTPTVMPDAATLRLFQVTGVQQDHRHVSRGDLFVARSGAKFDSHQLLAQAVAAGAVALVGDRPPLEVGALGAPYVQVSDARRALPYLAAAFHRHPSERLRVLGVTGTDGKTTTSYLLHWLLAGTATPGLSSTAGLYLGTQELAPEEGHFTTPEATAVQELLARFVAGGATHAVLESSSHGFAMHRLDAVRYSVGLFTNLTPEHLDYHGGLAEYREAKATLMRRAPISVLNRDDEAYDYFAAASNELITYGQHPGAELRIVSAVQRQAGTLLELDVRGERLTVDLPLLGSYNAHNAAAALGAALLEGADLPDAATRLASFPGVPGRMQIVAAEPTVIVDFAHTGPALTKALEAVRRPGARLIVVIGAAGERDDKKRGLLGRAAVTGADLALFTEEDSRSEDVDRILEQMAQGARAAGATAGKQFLLQPDRREAIRQAIAAAAPGDVVLLAGKGHERTLERANVTLPWDEAAEARAALTQSRS
jgi:UDP-N-acetylmuramoyl-L-alanyl-D-glutamate--2,6-diaminopimelate ligase